MLRSLLAILVVLLTFPACLDPVLSAASEPASNNGSTAWQGKEDLDQWNLIVHFNTTENIASIATDSDGNVYVIGYVTGAMTSGFSFTTSWWIKKFDSTGREIRVGWDKRLGFGTVGSRGLKIIAAKDNTVYAAGYYQVENSQFFQILHFNANGDLLGSIDLKSDCSDVKDILVDDSGNLYVCGYVYSTKLSVVASYAPDGVQRWKKNVSMAGQSANLEAMSMAFDINGNLLVAGTGIDLVSTDSNFDSWYKAYSVNDGSVVYDHYFTMLAKSAAFGIPDSVPTDDRVRTISVGKNGTIYLAGYAYNIEIYAKQLANGTYVTSPVNCNSGFILGFDSSKKIVFEKRFSTKPEKNVYVLNMILDSEDNIIVTGIDENSAVVNARDWFIMRFAADKSVWKKLSPVTGGTFGLGLAATAGTSFFAAACFENLYSISSGQDWWIRKFY